VSNIGMYRGDTRRFTLTITRDGVPENLTGAEIDLSFKETIDSVEAFHKSIGSGVEVTNLLGGIAVVTILPIDTSAMVFSKRASLVFDVQLTTSAGDVETIARGTLIIEQDVTI
jgi:hypothetical protein